MKLSKLFVVLSVVAASAQAVVTETAAPAREFVPGEFIVKFKETRGQRALGAWAQSRGFKMAALAQTQGDLPRFFSLKARRSALQSLDLQTLDAAKDVARTIAALPGIDYVEPNYIYRYTYTPTIEEVTPNDPKFIDQWGLKNSGNPGADIHAVDAWLTTRGKENVVVGVVDTGINFRHPDLALNIWSMPGRPDVHGYNAVTNTFDPTDDSFVTHGTHCAGIIGAHANNGQGVAGVNWNVRMMGVRFLDRNGSGSLEDVIEAMNFAIANGVKIINASWGGSQASNALRDVIVAAGQHGVLVVAAAGNESNNNDVTPMYPASYALDNIVSVAATTRNDTLADFSNSGVRTVLLAAPGAEIVSTYGTDGYMELDGTSMAAPHVTGAAALAVAFYGDLSPAALKEKLAQAVDVLPSLSGRVKTGGRLNLAKLFSTQP